MTTAPRQRRQRGTGGSRSPQGLHLSHEAVEALARAGNRSRYVDGLVVDADRELAAALAADLEEDDRARQVVADAARRGHAQALAIISAG